MQKLGMPYMGSKRKLASKIVDKILQDNPKTKYVYDLFGGGGAVSFEFIQRPQIKKVIYNELNTGVVALLRDIKENGITEKYYQWIDRETFMKHKGDDDWFGGLCKVVWSFGNNQKCYLFGKDLEENKRLAHLITVNKDLNAKKELEEIIGIDIPASILESDTITERRLQLTRYLKSNLKSIKEGNFKEKFEKGLNKNILLQRLQQLERLEQLELSNLSLEEVVIDTPIEETIIYLDPPYINTAKYAEELNHDKLYEWIKNSPYKIYLSSYESELERVAEFEHRTTLSGVKSSGKTLEKLFVNKI